VQYNQPSSEGSSALRCRIIKPKPKDLMIDPLVEQPYLSPTADRSSNESYPCFAIKECGSSWHFGSRIIVDLIPGFLAATELPDPDTTRPASYTGSCNHTTTLLASLKYMKRPCGADYVVVTCAAFQSPQPLDRCATHPLKSSNCLGYPGLFK